MKTRPQTWILNDGCHSRSFATQVKSVIREAVNFNVAEICSRCSGAICCGDEIKVFHAKGHLTAEEVVARS